MEESQPKNFTTTSSLLAWEASNKLFERNSFVDSGLLVWNTKAMKIYVVIFINILYSINEKPKTSWSVFITYVHIFFVYRLEYSTRTKKRKVATLLEPLVFSLITGHLVIAEVELCCRPLLAKAPQGVLPVMWAVWKGFGITGSCHSLSLHLSLLFNQLLLTVSFLYYLCFLHAGCPTSFLIL